MIKLCVFDLDGTVMDTLNSIAYFVNVTMAEMNLPKIETEHFKYFAGDGRATLILRSLKHNNADTKENFELATKIYDKAYEGNFMYLTSPFEGVFEQLQKLKNAGVNIAVLSNKPHNVTELVTEKAFGKGFFSYVAGQKESVPKKPAPDGLIAIANEFGVNLSECVMVGDTNVDMQTAKNAGAHSVGVLWGFRPQEELIENGAEKLVLNMKNLADTILSF